MKRTARGFAIYAEVKDSHGCVVRVQESSQMAARSVGYSATSPDGDRDAAVPHLTKAQAKRVIAALTKFAEGP